MNLRDVKKDIDFFVGEFIEDCALFLTLNPKKATPEVDGVIEEAVELYNNLKDQANAKVEGNKRIYFNQLRKDMFEGVDALYEKLSETIKASK